MNSPILRAVERVVAGVLLLGAAPIIAATAMWVWVHSGSPLLYRSGRVGRGGRTFFMLKLRTMQLRKGGEAWDRTASLNDPRFIAGCQWMRRRKLDELLQLVNIVRGDMAFVGPRPDLPEDVASYSEVDRRILDVLPGLTDLASVRYFDMAKEIVPTTMESADAIYRTRIATERMRLRREYVDRKSLGLDARILVRTIELVVFGCGSGR